jgi:hypothetical protein
MNHRRITIVLMSAGLMIGACEKHETPREELAEARGEHRGEIREASQLEDQDEKAKKVAKANKELAQEHADAYEDVDENNKGAARNADRGRFGALKDETDRAFVVRAKERIDTIQRELTALAPAEQDRDEIKDVKDKLAEARKDLDEFQDDDLLVDDGKIGVTVAINAAERQLDDLRTD